MMISAHPPGSGQAGDGLLIRAAARLAGACLLCGATAKEALCQGCAAQIEPLPPSCCPVCALPLPASAGSVPCGRCLATPPHFDTTLAACVYGFPLDRLVQMLKFGHRLAAARFLAALLLRGSRPAGDCLMAVPLSEGRLRQRGFNQAIEIARPCARALGLPLLLDDGLRVRDTVPQSELPWQARRKNIRHAFEYRGDLTGRSVIVVDDVMTTGATLDELAATLKKAGARRVSNWVVARTPALKDQ